MSSVRIAPVVQGTQARAQKCMGSNSASSAEGVSCMDATKDSTVLSGTGKLNSRQHIHHGCLLKARCVSKCIIENSCFSLFMTFITLYALFGNDLRLSLTDTSADRGFIVCAWLCIALFLLEMMFNSLSFDYYFGGFYFWIDLVSTLSILSEIPIVVNSLSSVFSGEGGSTTEMMKAGKAGRVGTRASRIIRIVRLVRMVRVVKLYKMHHANDEVLVDDTLEPTQVGKKLTEVTTRRLILMMLTMIMVLPWLQSSSLVVDTYNFHHNYLRHLHQYPQNYNMTGNISEFVFRGHIRFYVEKSVYPIMYLEVCEPQYDLAEYAQARECNTTWSHGTLRRWAREDAGLTGKYIKEPRRGVGKNGVKGSRQRAMSVARLLGHRASEVLISSHVGCYTAAPPSEFHGGKKVDGPTGGGRIDKEEQDFQHRYKSPTCMSIAVFSIRRQERLLAGLAILKTLFIMVVLVYASIEFNRDAKVFVIGPIERMMTLVKRLSQNPLDSANLDSTTYLDDDREVRDQGYETILLEQTLERIGQLLQVGFGAAGAEIIGKNMNTCSGKLNPMIAGKKITAIYGFCDIRQFTDTTECLQEEVMVYVNKLGNMVHAAAHSHYGMANKNVGDAFLLSWKICDGSVNGFTSFSDKATEAERVAANESVLCLAANGAVRTKRQITPSQMADAAITAFLKCQIELENENEDGCLSCYATYNAVVQRFGRGFKIQMGFGMHVGWAIEGAIGSDLKIDATYLSPHVEMSDRLEAASKIFKAKLNMSHWLVNLATPDIKQYIRAIAYIRCEGVPVPVMVYTFDVTNNDNVFGTASGAYDKTRCKHVVDWNKSEYKCMQRNLQPGFWATFTMAFTDFVSGDWIRAKVGFSKSLALKDGDGPTKYLVNFMSSHEDIVPVDWDGTHFLDGF